MFPIFIMFDSDRLSLSFVKVSKREDSRLLCEFYIEQYDYALSICKKIKKITDYVCF